MIYFVRFAKDSLPLSTSSTLMSKSRFETYRSVWASIFISLVFCPYSFQGSVWLIMRRINGVDVIISSDTLSRSAFGISDKILLNAYPVIDVQIFPDVKYCDKAYCIRSGDNPVSLPNAIIDGAVYLVYSSEGLISGPFHIGFCFQKSRFTEYPIKASKVGGKV